MHQRQRRSRREGEAHVASLSLPLGDDRFKFTGTITVPSGAIGPVTDGFRVIITDATAARPSSTRRCRPVSTATPRPRAEVNGPHTAFVYKNKGGTVLSLSGVNKATVKKSTKIPGQVKFNVAAAGGAYPLPASLPLKGTVILDPPYASTNQCGDALFPGPTSPACAYTAPVGTIKCK